MHVGRTCDPKPEGFLPVFTTDTEEEARTILVMTCKRDVAGRLYAPELAEEQTLERLAAFGERLRAAWRLLKQKRAGPERPQVRRPRRR